MKFRKYWILSIGLLLSIGCFAGSSVNTIGSTEGVAKSGYDPVAFFTDKNAIKWAPNFTYVVHGTN